MKRIKTAVAAQILGVTDETVRVYAGKEWLTAIRSDPDSVRSNLFFDADEVEAFARGGVAGVKAYRESVGPKASPKRGRKVGVK